MMGETNLSAAEFYSNLGEHYDGMTGDARRWERIKEDYAHILEGLGNPRVLDAGCGTGGEAILLASLGCEVVGLDVSPELLDIARRKSGEAGASVEFICGDITDLSNLPETGFGLIICRGNTLPHLRTIEGMEAAFRAFHRVALPDALLILGWLNYIPILAQCRRLVGVTDVEGSIFVRFYDLHSDEEIAFNILTLTRSSEPEKSQWESDLVTTPLRPWSADDIGMLLRKCSWGELEIGSDLKRNDFVPDDSKDVVFFALKR